MHFGAEPFDAADATALAAAQQAEMRDLYGGEADIGPAREAARPVSRRGIDIGGDQRADHRARASGAVQ